MLLHKHKKALLFFLIMRNANMTDSIVYTISDLSEYSAESGINLVFSYSNEKRATKVIEHCLEKAYNIVNTIIIMYNNNDVPVELEKKLEGSTKYYIRLQEIQHVDIAYSIPFDYVFYKEPFTSYHSYNGDLKMYELLGFSGPGESLEYKDLYMFLGFEGALGLKVSENCQYTNLILVNNLPSFFQKYKDISVINNYQLLQAKHQFLYTPADNPYETYNLLDSIIGEKDQSICIAPLSTKPVALGVCMFALKHDNIRIVYPIPVTNDYLMDNTLETYRTNVYAISI